MKKYLLMLASLAMAAFVSVGPAFAGDTSAEAAAQAVSGSGAVSQQGQSIYQNFEGSTSNTKVVNAPDAVAPGLTTSYANTCHGSTSGGASFGNGAVAIGASFGTTWKDEGCEARLDSRELRSLGQKEAALERLCQIPENAAALRAAGRPCLADQQKTQAEAAEAQAYLEQGNVPQVVAKLEPNSNT
ncbi:MAG: hypothetical protein OQJ98_01935 [Candidatus Pacebacteria bacterium]|nr:hypothetical protein [Candidatus Paceibacterota bacterium]